MAREIPNLYTHTWSDGLASEWMESLRTRAKARRDEIYIFITHIPVAIGMRMSPRRKKELIIISICVLMTFIVVERLSSFLQMAERRHESVMISKSCHIALAGI